MDKRVISVLDDDQNAGIHTGLVWIIGAFVIILGVLLMALGFKLRGLERSSSDDAACCLMSQRYRANKHSSRSEMSFSY